MPYADTDNFADVQRPPSENFEQRCLCLLLLDTSGSMSGGKISEFNSGMQQFQSELAQDRLASKRVEVAVVTFGSGVTEVTPFTEARAFVAPHLVADGWTPMGEAVEHGLELLRRRKDGLRADGIPMYRPWVFLITDGAPTDAWDEARRQVEEGELSSSFAFFCVGVQGADQAMLGDLSVRAPLMLKGLAFRELFLWLSASMKSVSQSQPGDKVPLPSPAGWTEV